MGTTESIKPYYPGGNDMNKNGTKGSGHVTGVTPKNRDNASRRLTAKEHAYIKHLTTNPKATKREALKVAYDVKPDVSDSTVDSMIGKIEKRQPVLAILTARAEQAEHELGELIDLTMMHAKSGSKEGAQYAGVAERAVNSLLDRVHGKAKQSMDVSVKAVTLNVDLSGDS